MFKLRTENEDPEPIFGVFVDQDIEDIIHLRIEKEGLITLRPKGCGKKGWSLFVEPAILDKYFIELKYWKRDL